MKAIYVQGCCDIDYTPGADVAAGDVIVQGDLIGVAKRAIPASTLGVLTTDGVFDFPKVAGGGTAITAGTKVYWDPVASAVTATAGALKYLGKMVKDAADADTAARVRLQQ